VVGVGLATLNRFPVGVLHDDAVYVILAKALSSGEGYRYLNLPGHPFATHFPPGYPAFLALLSFIVPSLAQSVVAFKIANVGCLAATYVGLQRLLRVRGGLASASAATVAVIATIGVPMLLLTCLVLSEPLFLALTVLGIVWIERTLARDASMLNSVALGAFAGGLTLVRTSGLALVGAAVLCLLLRRRLRDAVVVFACAALVVFPWMMWSSAHSRDVPPPLQGAYGTYGGWLGEAVRDNGFAFLSSTVAKTSHEAFGVIAATLAPFSPTTLRAIALLALIPVAAFGIRRVWKLAPSLLLFLALYTITVLIWPTPPVRYVWGVWPLIATVLALGEVDAFHVARANANVAARTAVLVVAAIPVIAYGNYNLVGFRDRQWLNIPAAGGSMLRPLIIGIRGHTTDSDVVASSAEAAVYLYANRTTVPIYSFTAHEFFRPADVAEQSRAVRAIVAAYPVSVVVATTAFQQQVMRQLPEFVVRDSFPGALIYRRQ
jgi:hypothetical protein